MNTGPEDIFDQCLDQMNDPSKIKKVMDQAPGHAWKFRDMISIVRNIQLSKRPEIPEDAIDDCLIKVGKAFQRKNKDTGRSFFSFRLRVAAILVCAVFLLAWGTVRVSASSVPGDMLYPVKIVTEKFRFLLTLDPAEGAELRITVSEERVRELLQLMRRKEMLETDVVRRMLDEASQALLSIDRLPKENRLISCLRMETLTNLQTDILAALQANASPGAKKELEDAMKRCRCSMDRILKMKSECKKKLRCNCSVYSDPDNPEER